MQILALFFEPIRARVENFYTNQIAPKMVVPKFEIFEQIFEFLRSQGFKKYIPTYILCLPQIFCLSESRISL